MGAVEPIRRSQVFVSKLTELMNRPEFRRAIHAIPEALAANPETENFVERPVEVIHLGFWQVLFFIYLSSLSLHLELSTTLTFRFFVSDAVLLLVCQVRLLLAVIQF